MAVKLNETYPGRANNPSAAYPQGSFKNRTAPGAQDGTYLEQQWANDMWGFLSSLIDGAGLTPNGLVDQVGASQYFDAMTKLINSSASVVGTSRSVRMSIPSDSAMGTLTADEIIVKTSLSGEARSLNGFSETINLAITGVGGMDTGAAPANSYVAVYAIYNPTTDNASLLATSAPGVVPQVYGGANMPSGYTHSSLVAVWRTTPGALFLRGLLIDRKVTRDVVSILATSTQQAPFLNFTLAAFIPANAKRIWGVMTGQSTLNSAINTYIAADNLGLGAVYGGGVSTGTTSSYMLDLVTPQQAAYSFTSTAGSPSMNYYLTAYEF